MRAFILTAVCAFCMPLAAMGQGCPNGNCSGAAMILTSASESCQKPSSPKPLYGYPAGGTQTYLDEETTADGGVVWSASSSQTVPMISDSAPPEDGECWWTGSQWQVCPGIWETQIVDVIDGSTEVWQFYNRGYSAAISGSTCVKTDAFFGQNFQQVGAVCCQCTCTPDKCSNTVTGDSTGCPISPIVVDTTGHGFQLTSAGVIFDIAADGHPLQMAWTARGSGNAFLALDRNHNGKIDNGKELFGNFTEQALCPEGGISCRNGFRALAEFDRPENDGNGDGIIDRRDAVYSKLLLWIDENHDGISQPNELHTPPELGVYSIDLHYREEPFRDAHGNAFRYRAALNPDPKDGTSKDGRWTYDVFFTADRTRIVWQPNELILTPTPRCGKSGKVSQWQIACGEFSGLPPIGRFLIAFLAAGSLSRCVGRSTASQTRA